VLNCARYTITSDVVFLCRFVLFVEDDDDDDDDEEEDEMMDALCLLTGFTLSRSCFPAWSSLILFGTVVLVVAVFATHGGRRLSSPSSCCCCCCCFPESV